MKAAAAVASGAFVGVLLRVALIDWLALDLWGLFAVNAIGCLVLGAVNAWPDLTSETKLFLTTGLLGSFTTFSAFAATLVSYAASGQWTVVIGYAAVSVTAGVLLFMTGAVCLLKRR